mgnify:CR=1 FL=1
MKLKRFLLRYYPPGMLLLCVCMAMAVSKLLWWLFVAQE